MPIVLISHNMPHVFEVADRIHIHRLGRRLCVIDPKDYTMSDAVAFMTGAKEPPAEATGRVNLDALASDIRARAEGRARFVFAVAGPPGAGKSTFAEALVAALEAVMPGEAALMPMDGYHLDNAILIERGLLPRKGAPQTFDVDGLARDLERLRAGGREVVVPVFDRTLDLARAGARSIRPEHRVIVIEGNYLLLDQAALERARALLRPHALPLGRPGRAAPPVDRPLAGARTGPCRRACPRRGERPAQREAGGGLPAAGRSALAARRTGLPPPERVTPQAAIIF